MTRLTLQAVNLRVNLLHNISDAGEIFFRCLQTQFGFMAATMKPRDTSRIFTNPRHQLTEDYVSGRFG
mgnify:CR=1 FL=1